MNRRELLKHGAILGSAALLDRSAFAFADSPLPVAKTAHGPIRGHINDGITFFKGVPYGASTAGKTVGILYLAIDLKFEPCIAPNERPLEVSELQDTSRQTCVVGIPRKLNRND